MPAHHPRLEKRQTGESAGTHELADELGRRIKAAKPDVLIEIAPDHWVNFFITTFRASASAWARSTKAPPSRG